MGLNYKLNNGEYIQIDMEVRGKFEKIITIILFGGSTTFEYDYCENNDLNEIIEDIEKNYNEYLKENLDFDYKCYTD